MLPAAARRRKVERLPDTLYHVDGSDHPEESLSLDKASRT
jgi:hypothetical protein